MLVTATVRDTEQLHWWLLGFGDLVKVLAPPALHDEIALTLRSASAAYGARHEELKDDPSES